MELIGFVSLIYCILSFQILPFVICGKELPEFHRHVLEILRSDSYSMTLIPPVEDEKSALKVFVNLGLRDIENIDDKKMELKIQLSLRQRWTDIRLKFDSKGQDGYVTLPSNMEHTPWTPDTFVNNEKQSTIHSITGPNSYFRLYPNGSIHQSVRVSITVSCFMDLRRFPFDKQTCELRLASYSHQVSSIEYFWDPNDEALENIGSKHLTQFQLTEYKTGKCLTKTKVTGAYSALFFVLAFKRRVGYYVLQFFAPSSMLVAMSWIPFWLGSAVEARLSMTVTVLLTLTTQISGIHQNLPPVSYATGFSSFSGICVTFGVLAIFQTSVVFSLLLKDMPFEYRQLNIANFTRGKVRQSTPTPMETVDTNGKQRGSMTQAAFRIDQISKILFPVVFLLVLISFFGPFLWGYWFSPNELFENSEALLTETDGLCRNKQYL